jgi:hypothetical protein
MKPFYRILTHTALVLQSFIILYLLSFHQEDAQKRIDACQRYHEASLYQGGASFNKLSALLQFSSDSIKTLLPNVTLQWNHNLTE